MIRAAAFAALLLVSTAAPLAAARLYQTSRVRDGLADRLAAPREPVSLVAAPAPGDDSRVVLETRALPAQALAAGTPGIVTSEYLVARIGGAACRALQLPVTMRYRAPSTRGDFTRTLQITLPANASEDVEVLEPVFFRYRTDADVHDFADRWADYQFRGFELAVQDRECLQRVDRIVAPERFPVLLSAKLVPGWRAARFYQTLATLERRDPNAAALHVFTAPGEVPVTRRMLSAALEPLDIQGRADALMPVAGRGWTLDGGGVIGGVRSPFGYLLTSAPRASRAGDELVVQGVLRDGGLSVGLLRDGQWLAQTPVVGRGPFLAVVRTPTDGLSTVVIANNLSGGARDNHVDIIRAGWMDRPGQP